MEISLSDHQQSLNPTTGSSPSGQLADVHNENTRMASLEVAAHLNLKQELLDPSVMGKINEMVEFYGSPEYIKELDFKLGNPDIPKIDKLYAHYLLDRDEQDYLEKLGLIRNQKESLYV